MDFTTQDILNEEHRKATTKIASISTKDFPKAYTPQAIAAMQRYAEQEAKTYANWVLTQDYDSMNATQMWRKYQKEVQEQ